MKSSIKTSKRLEADTFKIGTVYGEYSEEECKRVILCTYFGYEPGDKCESHYRSGGGICLWEKNTTDSFVGTQYHMGSRDNVREYIGTVTIENSP